MQRLPFNPEPLLAFFMTQENAGSLVGDLEERFQRVCQSQGRMMAILWFWRALLASIPSLVITQLERSQNALLSGHSLGIGREVAIVGGPLAGLTGTLVRIDDRRGRVVLSVSLLQRSVAVELEQRSVHPGSRWRNSAPGRMSFQRLSSRRRRR